MTFPGAVALPESVQFWAITQLPEEGGSGHKPTQLVLTSMSSTDALKKNGLSTSENLSRTVVPAKGLRSNVIGVGDRLTLFLSKKLCGVTI